MDTMKCSVCGKELEFTEAYPEEGYVWHSCPAYMASNDTHDSVKVPCHWVANLTDGHGNIITGYEQELEGSREEVLADYQYFLFLELDEEIPPERIDLELVDWE